MMDEDTTVFIALLGPNRSFMDIYNSMRLLGSVSEGLKTT